MRSVSQPCVVRASVHLTSKAPERDDEAFLAYLAALRASPLRPPSSEAPSVIVDHQGRLLYVTCNLSTADAHEKVARWVRSEVLNIWEQPEVVTGFRIVAQL